jgi:hypothetical protein
MARFSILSAAVLLIGSHIFATAQDASGQRGTEGPPTQCWDQTTNQLRQRTAEDASKKTAPSPGKSADSAAVESGSSEGMAGITPGSKGSASAQAAADAASPSGSARPPGMPNC